LPTEALMSTTVADDLLLHTIIDLT